MPSTAVSLSLARALRCSVEDLFRVSPAPRLSASFAWTPRAAKTGRPSIDEDAIADFLSGLAYPLAFLDYETFPAAIPRFQS